MKITFIFGLIILIISILIRGIKIVINLKHNPFLENKSNLFKYSFYISCIFTVYSVFYTLGSLIVTYYK